MPDPHIALSHTPDGPVELWASVERRYADGTISFLVLNGCWDGRLLDDMLEITSTGWSAPTGKIFEAHLVWSGKAPFASHRYNEAIDWIETQRKQWAEDRAMTLAEWASREGYDLDYLMSEPETTV